MDTFSSRTNTLDGDVIPSPSTFLQVRSFSRALPAPRVSSCLLLPTPPPAFRQALHNAQLLEEEHKEEFGEEEDGGEASSDCMMKIPKVIHVSLWKDHCDDNVSVLGWDTENGKNNAIANNEVYLPLPVFQAGEGYLQSRREIALFRADDDEEVEEGKEEVEEEEGKDKENDYTKHSKVSNKSTLTATRKGVQYYFKKKRSWFRGGSCKLQDKYDSAVNKLQGYYSIDKGGRFLYEI